MPYFLLYRLKGRTDSLAFDADSASVIKLSNNYVLYLREVDKFLSLVCLMRNESFTKQGLVEYNFSCFKKSMGDLFKAKQQFQPTVGKNTNKEETDNKTDE